MSGICGIWFKDDAGAAATLRLAAAGCSLEPSEQIVAAAADGGGVGAAVRFDGQEIYQDSRVLLACDTELFNEDELRKTAGTPRDAGLAAVLAALYQKLGVAFIEGLR